MATLYVVSPKSFSGKSSLSIGLGRQFQREGFSVGYMKPVSTSAKRVAGHPVDEDAEFIKRMFNLGEPLDILVPVVIEPFYIESVLRGQGDGYADKLTAAFGRVSAGKDVMILEGASSLAEGSLVGLPPHRVASLLSAKALLVVKYTSDLFVDDVLAAAQMLQGQMIGCVVNAIPVGRMDFVETVIVPFLKEHGVQVFGLLPQERVLQSVSVRELSEALGGEILCAENKSDELVENLMIGAMSVESALSFFRRKPNKAVITGGDRPDIQLAALETSTKALILTGNLYPSPIILNRAEELGVPMILVKQDTLTTMEISQQFFERSRFQQRKKLYRFEQILAEHLDFPALYQALGLKIPK